MYVVQVNCYEIVLKTGLSEIMDAAPTLLTQSVLHMAQMAQMVEQALRLTGHARSRVQIPLREFFYEKKNLPGGEVLPSNIKSSDE